MNTRENMIIIKGKFKTNSVLSCVPNPDTGSTTVTFDDHIVYDRYYFGQYWTVYNKVDYLTVGHRCKLYYRAITYSIL